MQPNPYHTHTKHTELYKVHDFYDLQSRLQALQPWAAHTIFPLQYIDSANVMNLHFPGRWLAMPICGHTLQPGAYTPEREPAAEAAVVTSKRLSATISSTSFRTRSEPTSRVSSSSGAGCAA